MVRLQADDAYKIVLGFRYIDDIVIEEERQKKLLAVAAEQARQSNEAKTEFLRRMNHDIRTPINGVMGMLRMAENHIEEVDKTQECIQKALAASEQLLLLVNDILDISKLEANDFAVEDQSFDFILMDIMMPVMDGLEATRQIRSLGRMDSARVPILALSANAFEDDVKRSLAAGMDAHLTKPLDLKKTIRELQDVLKMKNRGCFC